MGLPLAPGPRAACCPPAFPPLLVNCLGAPPWAQEGESWRRASFAPSERDPRQEKGPAGSFSVLLLQDGREGLGFPFPGSMELS